AFKVRFGFANNHTLGNLMLSALEVTSGGFPEAIAICEELLGARGKVYPSTLDRVTLVAKTGDGRTLEGQAVACHSRSALRRVALKSDSEILAYQPACKALMEADLIVLGPGSLFTSIIPNLIVPGIVDAIRASHATTVFVCSLADMQGETRGMTPLEHFDALCAHGMEGLVDFMLAQSIVPEDDDGRFKRLLVIDDNEASAVERRGTSVMRRDLVDHDQPTWHDPVKLRHAFAEVLK
ncbi:MAG: YvcK family protein, partial [Eggerthellaceae bacterium]|nr:YvcK family protein [Eggerthellaceae bacterium]